MNQKQFRVTGRSALKSGGKVYHPGDMISVDAADRVALLALEDAIECGTLERIEPPAEKPAPVQAKKKASPRRAPAGTGAPSK